MPHASDAMPIATPAWSSRGSGDVLADRLFAYARRSLEEGDTDAAADLARQVVDRVPAWPPAWLLLGEAERAGGRADAARGAFFTLLLLDPADRIGAGLHLAALGVTDLSGAMTPAYVAALFDDYAPRFERHLTEELGYRGPQQIMEALRQAGCPVGSSPRVVDIGCGTGLMGEALRGAASHVAGCDLSAAMIALAARRGIYDELAVADAVAFLAGRPAGTADLVTAADVLIYVGAVEPLLGAVAHALRPGGCFAFTIQTGPGTGTVLGPDMRYHHAVPGIADVARAAGLPVLASTSVALRLEKGQPVAGAVVLCRRSVP